MNRTEEKAYQKSLGPFLRFYYGVSLYKCCNVFPKLEHTKDFKDLCFWKCPVCGRETAKYDMPWLASKEWQEMTKPFEQISIWDILEEKKKQDDEWKPLFIQDYIEWTSDKTMPLVTTYHEFSPTDDPDVICKGTVNGVPALIGFREWVSGWDSCFTEYEAFKWKEL